MCISVFVIIIIILLLFIKYYDFIRRKNWGEKIYAYCIPYPLRIHMRCVARSIGAPSTVACFRPVCWSSCRVIIKRYHRHRSTPSTPDGQCCHTIVALPWPTQKCTHNRPRVLGHIIYCSPTSIIQPPRPLPSMSPSPPSLPINNRLNFYNDNISNICYPSTQLLKFKL